MPSTWRPMSKIMSSHAAGVRLALLALPLLILRWAAPMCRTSSRRRPSTTASWDSPTAADVKARYAAAEPTNRGWQPTTVAPESGIVSHLPLYMEDPFEDKGHGRTDETHPHDVYRGGWEDYVAIPYGFSRFPGNWLMFPVSAVVTTPWTIMESDSYLSRQLLGYDHDAVPTPHHVFETEPNAPPVESTTTEPAPQPTTPEPAAETTGQTT